MEEEKKGITYKIIVLIGSCNNCQIFKIIELASDGDIMKNYFQVFSNDMVLIGNSLSSLSAAEACAQAHNEDDEDVTASPRP